MGKKNSLWSLVFPGNNLSAGKAGNGLSSFFQRHIYISDLLLRRALLPASVTKGGPSLSELVSEITEESPSPTLFPGLGVGHSWAQLSTTGGFLVYLSGEASCDSQNGLCLPNRPEIITSKCYKDKEQIRNYCDITVSGQYFSSAVFTAFRLWHKRWSGKGLSAASPSTVRGSDVGGLFTYHLMDLVVLEKGSQSRKVEKRAHVVSWCRCEETFQMWWQSALKRGVFLSCHLQFCHPLKLCGWWKKSSFTLESGYTVLSYPVKLIWWWRLFLKGCDAF